MTELCGTFPSTFRQDIQARCGTIFPIPIILREIPNISALDSFEALLAQWWQQQYEWSQQSIKTPLQLDLLKRSMQQDDLQTLLLLDGIDEVGSYQIRQRLFEFALTAQQRGYRVIITGRPSGLDDLKLESLLTKESDTKELALSSSIKGLSNSARWYYVLPLYPPTN